MKIRKFLFASLVLATATAWATEDSAVTAEGVILRYIQALGGEKLIADCHSRHLEATFGQSGMTGQLSLATGESDMYRMTLVITGVGEFEEGLINGAGWTNDMMGGPQLMEGTHLAATLLRNRHNSELYYYDLYREIVFEGEALYDSVQCYKLRLDTDWGSTYEYFDLDTGLLRGSQGEMPMAGGVSISMSSVIKEYGTFDGRLYPLRTEQTTPMGIQTITLTSVTHGNVDPAVFLPPEPVQALLERSGED